MFVREDFDIYYKFECVSIYESHDPYDVVERDNREVVLFLRYNFQSKGI